MKLVKGQEVKDFRQSEVVGRSILELAGEDQNYLVALVDGIPKDLTYRLTGNEKEVVLLDFNSEIGRETYWHTTSHIMAQAVKELFPQFKVTIGPAIENGFYYDFDTNGYNFTEEDLRNIENKMKEIIKRSLPIERIELPKGEAIEYFKKIGEDYKIEILNEIPDESVSIYKQGDFADLCRGPHLPNTSYVKAIKLLSSSGSYWRGDENNARLQRIYGISFPTEEQLQEYLNKLEEAKRRDHRVLGKELDLFSVHEEIGPGLILWHPKGAAIRRVIEEFWIKEHLKRDYQLVYTPHVGRSKLWEISGHLNYYKENMYPQMELDNQQYYIKPMNCPFHIMIYKTKVRSYRDLPIRYCELGTVYRYERSGVLHGLLRVRGFTQDDAHIFARPDQILDEIKEVVKFAYFILNRFGFKEYEVFVSTRPKDSVGSPEMWEEATKALMNALNELNIPYKIDEGAGAFYGPKIDITIKDALGRSWQCTTIQFDFNLPERFDVTYRDKDGIDKRPYLIHRALLGSFERFFATLIEYYGGNFPLWLAPIQVAVLPISEENVEYADKIYKALKDNEIRVTINRSDEKLNAKIRDAEIEKIPYMVIVGKKEREQNLVSVRKHSVGDLGKMTLEQFLNLIKEEIKGGYTH
uniref:Threonine--tRNA ligase n=1 Tax=candidate division WOR-3 bacterium TaxID=2052148 RepID=A0A7V3KMF7_UNCW3